MAWTLTDLASIEAAIKTGVRRVIYDGPPQREIEYQSLKEMRDLRAEMKAELAGDAGGRRVRFAVSRTGFR